MNLAHLAGVIGGIFLPSGFDASPSQVTPSIKLLAPIYTPGRREAL